MEIETEISDGVMTIILNRPDERNTMTYRSLDALHSAVREATENPRVRAVIVTGAGRYFSAGTDLTPGQARLESADADKPWQGGVGAGITLQIYRSPKPFIAAINGTAAGIGMTMTLPMDFRIAAHTARFGIPYVRRGILPESASSWFLPKIVGITRATDWALTGRIFDAQEALSAGLVSELLPANSVLGRAREIATEIASTTSAISVAYTRQLLWRRLGDDSPSTADLWETAGLRDLVGSPDVAEGFRSFREKRAPAFSHVVPDDLPASYHEMTRDNDREDGAPITRA